MKVILSHAVHLSIENVYLIFYVDQLHFAADNTLSSQSQLDDQSAPIHINDKEKWYINKIIAKKFHCYDYSVIKWL